MVDLDTFRSAFPGGDHDGHRRYHETQIEILEEKRRLRKAIQEKTISGLIWAAVLWLLTLIAHEAQDLWTRLPPPH